ncbi:MULTISPECIES: cell envelope integrity protein TolA [Cupriavidus]|uniref:cell envelope integrity protein TolA n=1 Tax=Cupriavidus sp. DF5525 TaxID=3160989 RepID=UPI0003B00C71|nr:TonB-denpendent receptor [Ralstonia pickettii DTP0602]
MQNVAYPYQPVRERGTLTCFLLALLMHLLLGALLYYGVRWRSAAPEGVTAELWEAIPETAMTEPPTTPVPSAKPVEEEEADISLQEKQRKAERAAREEAQALRESRARAEAERKEAQRKAAEAQRQASTAQRQSELARLQAQAQAGSAGSGAGTGSAAKASSGYAERVRQRVKPNIIFNEEVSGNPAAVVAVHMAPDGSVLSTRLAKSSGNTAWDNAVLRAVSRSDPLPRDENGVAPANILITFWPKDLRGS